MGVRESYVREFVWPNKSKIFCCFEKKEDSNIETIWVKHTPEMMRSQMPFEGESAEPTIFKKVDITKYNINKIKAAANLTSSAPKSPVFLKINMAQYSRNKNSRSE